MTSYAMRLTVPASVPSRQAGRIFYWTADRHCSFSSPYGPRLGGLGPVLEANVEFMRLAAAVFAADRTTPRSGGGSNWNQRQIELSVPVFDATRWEPVAGDMASLLSLLTGDEWNLQFYRSRSAKEAVKAHSTKATRVVLLSGGADSAVGALVSRARLEAGETHTLLSHVGLTVLSAVQQTVAAEIARLLPGSEQPHVQVNFRRRSTQVEGTSYTNEPSSRSRSLLFLALGLAVASLDGVPLWMPENGFASLNPPLGAERRGSLSTRTTHPAFIEGLGDVLGRVGAHAQIENPLAGLTKGQVFSLARDTVGPDPASILLSSTHSCGWTGQRAFGISPIIQCGVCFGCVLRRSAFVASSLSDRTAYIAPQAASPLSHRISEISVIRAVQDFVRRGVRTADIAAMSLPPSYPATRAMELCQRGVEELRTYVT
jgi:7-cyano-7-deazaguanine synthase in queuosine biosynthesis